jgi:hypothetical protein
MGVTCGLARSSAGDHCSSSVGTPLTSYQVVDVHVVALERVHEGLGQAVALGTICRCCVLRPSLTAKQQTLFLLYHEPTSVVLAKDLYAWAEYDQLRTYHPDVLWPLHEAWMTEFDEENDAGHLPPTGACEVETKILKQPIPGGNGARPA